MTNKKTFDAVVCRYQLNVPGDENDGKIYVGCTRDEKGRLQNWLKSNNKNYGGEKISAAREKYPPN